MGDTAKYLLCGCGWMTRLGAAGGDSSPCPGLHPRGGNGDRVLVEGDLKPLLLLVVEKAVVCRGDEEDDDWDGGDRTGVLGRDWEYC